MRDHAIGAFGAVALVVVLLFEASLLASETSAWSAFAAAAACGRWAALPLAAFLPAAREEGTALSNLSVVSVALGLLAACAVAVGVRGLEGLVAVGAAALTALVLGLFFRRWLGGVTGDTLGATSELAQAAALAALLARMTRLLLIRHAEPDEAARGRCYGRLDVGLSPAGARERRAARRSLRAVELDAVYVSPRLRAVQTASALGASRTVDDRLRELDFGQFEGTNVRRDRARAPRVLPELDGDTDARQVSRRRELRASCASASPPRSTTSSRRTPTRPSRSSRTAA